MKELFAAFNTDFFRALATLIIPGSIAISTWTIELILRFNGFRRLFEQNPVERAFVLFLAIVFIGMVIEDIGSRIESWLDRGADRESDHRHTEQWYAYLKTAFVCEPIGRRYVRTLVTRLKFELGSAVAILIADAGLICLWMGGFSPSWLTFALIGISLGVAAYLGLCEAPASHRLLAKARNALLDGVNVVKG